MTNPLHFPDDLIYDILSRLPTKSLIRFRCVSKTWNSLIHDPYFLQLRQSISHTRNLFLFVCPNPSHRPKEIPRPHVFLEQLPIHEDQWDIMKLNNSTCILSMRNLRCWDLGVQSVNGLLCFHPRHGISPCYSSQQARVTTYIYNPTTRQLVTLPGDDDTIYFGSKFFILTHFGYDPLQDKFKVLHFITEGRKCHELRILTIGDYVWRNITRVIPSNLRSDILHLTTTGCCVNGVIYWKVFTEIIAFDMGREQFREIPVPHRSREFELVELGGYLSLIEFSSNRLIELSILKDYQNHVWIHDRIIVSDEIHGIPMTPRCYLPICKVYSEEILLLSSSYVDHVQYYNLKKRSSRSILFRYVKLYYQGLHFGGLRLFPYQENFMLL